MAVKGNCPYAQHKQQGLKQWFVCDVDGKMCPFVRYCPTEHIVHLTAEANLCKNRNKDE